MDIYSANTKVMKFWRWYWNRRLAYLQLCRV